MSGFAAGKTEILFGTDIHYLAPSLTDGGEMFTSLVEGADGKLPERSGEVLDEFIQTALDRKPDAVVIAGDLTFNGEYQSLAECAAKLKALKKEGIPVLVIPGNHDIAYPYACRYEGDKAFRVRNVPQEEFAVVCGELGYGQALSKCPVSFSYTFEIPGRCVLLLLDSNTEADPGALDQETLIWAREELARAGERQLPVISFTHQNVLRQSRVLYQGFVIRNEDEVRELLLEGNVRVNFSGHSHIQHTASVSRTQDDSAVREGPGDFTDYAIGCMTVYPLHYAWIEAEGGDISVTPMELSSCKEEAEARFDVCTSRQVAKALEGLEIPEDKREDMIRFAVEVNKAYFAGRLEDSFKEEEEWRLWKRYAKATFWYAYFSSMSSGS